MPRSGPVYPDAVLEERPVVKLNIELVHMRAVGFHHWDASLVSLMTNLHCGMTLRMLHHCKEISVPKSLL